MIKGMSNLKWIRWGVPPKLIYKVFVSFFSGNECVPLPQCKLLNWMWRHRTEIPQENSETVVKFITSLRCGLDVCPKAKKIKSRDRNPLVHGLKRNPVKKPDFHQLVDYGCKPFLK